MTEILLHSSPTSISSTPSSALSHRDDDDDDPFFSLSDAGPGEKPISISRVTLPHDHEDDDDAGGKDRDIGGGDQLSFLALLVTIFRKPFTVACRAGVEDLSGMEIGLPTNVRHVAHVTFDRFNGFRGLPDEFQPEVSKKAPSASTTVFGVSTGSMQLAFDGRGNSVPTILLLMQRCLYARGGLQAEGIFRIAAGNSQEEYVRDQLNRGVVPEDIDVHCLAGLIKAWFRELPTGVLDSLSSEQVIQCKSEEDYDAVMRRLPSTDAALLDWSINLMADVVQQEYLNKMNAHNIAVVFAPNMTQVSDPETALTHTVKIMNFLSSLIITTLKERERSSVVSAPISQLEPCDKNGGPSPSLPCPKDASQQNPATKPAIISEKPVVESYKSNELLNRSGGESCNGSTSVSASASASASASGLNGHLASETEKRPAHSSKASSLEKLPSSPSTVTKCRNGPEIGKQHGVKLTGEAEESFGDESLYCLNTVSARIVESWR